MYTKAIVSLLRAAMKLEVDELIFPPLGDTVAGFEAQVPA
jgi:hypothetical protein